MLNLDMKIDVKVDEKEYKGTVKEIMQINEATLTDEFIRQPSLYAYFAALSEYAVADVEHKKFTMSVLRANLDTEKRLDLSAKSGKVTESMVDAAITLDKRYQVLQEDLIESERQLGILKSLVKALEQRKDMLIQIGSTKRQELNLQDFGININKVKGNNL